MSKHIFYKTGDADAPEQIMDRNGAVVLQLCRRCNLAEVELEAICSPASNLILSALREEIEYAREMLGRGETNFVPRKTGSFFFGIPEHSSESAAVIDRLVAEAFKNGRENGDHEVLEGPAADVAGDMIAYDDDIREFWGFNCRNDKLVIDAVNRFRDSERN